MNVVALAGGIGGARFLRGLLAWLDEVATGSAVTVIGNTGDDITLHGLRICPDLDTVMYTLGGGINEDQGWGRTGETWSVKRELADYGVGPDWFGLGDRDIATHLVRTEMLAAGYPLSQVTEALCDRWRPGVRLIPMSDERVETHVIIDESALDGSDNPGRRAIHFQEWWLRLGAAVPAREIVPVGAADAKPAPGVLEAIESADVIVFPPSNPVVSIGTILSVPGVRDAIAAARAPVVGVSPIIGGSPVRGMADACLEAIGVATSAEAVARHYGARGHSSASGEPGLLDGWLIDTTDVGAEVPGIEIRARPLLMIDLAATMQIAAAALELVDAHR